MPDASGHDVRLGTPATGRVICDICSNTTSRSRWLAPPEAVAVSANGRTILATPSAAGRGTARGHPAVIVPGDTNCDGGVSFFDIDPFVAAPRHRRPAVSDCDI